MGKILWVMLPNIILLISIVMQGATVLGGTGSACFTISTSATCSQNASSVVFSCPIGINVLLGGIVTTCPVSNSCVPAYPSPAFCFQGKQYILPGESVTVPATQVAGQGSFNFGSLGVGGFIDWIGIAVGVAVLAGFTIVGSGLNAASVKIMFISGLLLAIYVLLATQEGFISGGNLSFFTQLNRNVAIGTVSLGLGTLTYIAITLMETIGIITYIGPPGEE